MFLGTFLKHPEDFTAWLQRNRFLISNLQKTQAVVIIFSAHYALQIKQRFGITLQELSAISEEINLYDMHVQSWQNNDKSI